MALVLPKVLGYYSMYPFRRRNAYSTCTATFQTLQEQRYPENFGNHEYELNYTSISRADADGLSSFVALMRSQQQPFTFTQPITSVATFDTVNCYFTSPSFAWRETFEGQYSGSITFRTAQTQVTVPPRGAPTFPALFNSLYVQFPIERGVIGTYYISRLKCGAVYSAPIQNGTVFGPRTSGRRTYKWPLILNKTQLSILENFFVNQMGSYGNFAFTDPGSPAAAVLCRFASDSLDIQYLGVNNIRTTVSLIEDFS